MFFHLEIPGKAPKEHALVHILSPVHAAKKPLSHQGSPGLVVNTLLLRGPEHIGGGYSVCLRCHNSEVPVNKHDHDDYLPGHMKDSQGIADIVYGCGGNEDIGAEDRVKALQHKCEHGYNTATDADARHLQDYFFVKKGIEDAHEYHQGQDKSHAVDALFEGQLPDDEAEQGIDCHYNKGRETVFVKGYCDKYVKNAKKQLSQRMKFIHPVGSLLKILNVIKFSYVLFN